MFNLNLKKIIYIFMCVKCFFSFGNNLVNVDSNIVFSDVEYNVNNNAYISIYEPDENEYIYLDDDRSYDKTEKLNTDSQQQHEDSFDIKNLTGRWYLIASNDPLDYKGDNIYYDVRYEEKGLNVIKWTHFEQSNVWHSTNLRYWITSDKNNIYYMNSPKGYISKYSNEVLFFDKKLNYIVVHFKKNNTYKIFSRNVGNIILENDDLNKFQSIIKEIKKLYYVKFNNKYYDRIYELNHKNDLSESKIREIEEQLIRDDKSFLYVK